MIYSIQNIQQYFKDQFQANTLFRICKKKPVDLNHFYIKLNTDTTVRKNRVRVRSRNNFKKELDKKREKEQLFLRKILEQKKPNSGNSHTDLAKMKKCTKNLKK